MNVGEILDDLYRDLNINPTAATQTTVRFKSHINKAHVALLREPSLSRLRDTLQPLTFASVVSQSTYGLPSQLSRVYAITERDNDRTLASMSLLELRAADPGVTATGTPWAFVPMGYGPTQISPASTGVWVASSSASDTTQTALLNGVRTAGLPTGDLSAAMNGATRVQLGAITDIVDVQSLSISAVGAGVVSFFDAAVSGNTIAQIPIGLTSPRYFRLQLYPIPEAVITYYVDGQLNIPTLDDNQDVPMIPEEFHDLLASYARMREYERTGDAERMIFAQGVWLTGVARLKHMIGTSPAERPVMGRPTRGRFSRLGAWTPADSWW